jgi:hypothetical protein
VRDTLGGDGARMRVLLQELHVAVGGPRSLDARAAELVAFLTRGRR